MSQPKLITAVLIMPLMLLCPRGFGQMVPVAGAGEAVQTSEGDPLYTSSEEAPAAVTAVQTREQSGDLPKPPYAASAGSPVGGASTPDFAPPDSVGPEVMANSPTLANATSAAGPVTLPPRPAKVRDLPSVQGGDRPRIRPFQAASFGLTASTLGAGAEMAIPVSRTLNFRVGASYLNWNIPFNINGIDYDPGLKFTSGRGSIDWFPHHGAFHISAGALYFRNHIAGSADVVQGQSFSLGGTNYINSVDDPIHGTANVTYGKQIAPMLLLGFGNVLPRSGRHLSMPVEFGGAYMQPPTLALKLAGTACTNQGCFNAATDPQVQANLRKENSTLQSDIKVLAVYPIVSLGLACRF